MRAYTCVAVVSAGASSFFAVRAGLSALAVLVVAVAAVNGAIIATAAVRYWLATVASADDVYPNVTWDSAQRDRRRALSGSGGSEQR